MNDTPGFTTPFRPAWPLISPNFIDNRDCLAAFIALETAEVLAGVKPSSLVNLRNRTRACGRNLHRLWEEHGPVILAKTPLAVRRIGQGPDYTQLLFYLPGRFPAHLNRRDVATLLAKAGYEAPFTVDHTLDQLAERLKSGPFPHEIGMLLGYPLKDVAAFMGWSKLPFACQGPWKMFGNPRQSLRLAETFRSCRAAMAWRLSRTSSPRECVAPLSLFPPFFIY